MTDLSPPAYPGEPPLSPVGRALLSGPALGAALGLVVGSLLLFGFVPRLDLAAASLFYAGHNHFVGQMRVGDALRRAFYHSPFVVLAILALLWTMRRFGTRFASTSHLWAPSGRGMIVLLLSLAIGPGLLVNVALKDHSHRPRPMQVEEFGGTLPFRPVGRFDGGCPRNCSFVSGEGSLGFWMLAPALLAPPPLQPLLLAGAALFGLATGVLRMAFGGHFLSDTILAALSSWIVIIATWWLVFRRPLRRAF
ncbi:MAG TPA: phosphatase PAP2 family protein [Lichenihabitans sp.]|jgi:membrane-associated PAP2 superfamily phosphatase|nr:phosphatase PAP2 family protein [Lichenihabitans sp.]